MAGGTPAQVARKLLLACTSFGLRLQRLIQSQYLCLTRRCKVAHVQHARHVGGRRHAGRCSAAEGMRDPMLSSRMQGTLSYEACGIFMRGSQRLLGIGGEKKALAGVGDCAGLHSVAAHRQPAAPVADIV